MSRLAPPALPPLRLPPTPQLSCGTSGLLKKTLGGVGRVLLPPALAGRSLSSWVVRAVLL